MSDADQPDPYSVPVTAEEVRIQVSFVLGQARRSELRDWLSHDRTKSEAARNKIIERIVARIAGWKILRRPSVRGHSVPPAGDAVLERLAKGRRSE